MNYEFKNDLIFVNDEWLYTLDYLQDIVNDAASTTSKPMTLKFVHASSYGTSPTSKGSWKYPTIRVSSESEAELVQQSLFELGVDADIDLYEDDDGEGDGGRPIIRNLWSVQIPTIKLVEHDLDIPNRIESKETLVEFNQSNESLIARHKTKLSSELEVRLAQHLQIPCSKDLDNEWYNESNI